MVPSTTAAPLYPQVQITSAAGSGALGLADRRKHPKPLHTDAGQAVRPGVKPTPGPNNPSRKKRATQGAGALEPWLLRLLPRKTVATQQETFTTNPP